MSVEIDLIFKIAAIGIIVAVLHHLLNQAGKSEAGADYLPGGADCGADGNYSGGQRLI